MIAIIVISVIAIITIAMQETNIIMPTVTVT